MEAEAMDGESGREGSARRGCPLCALWDAYQRPEAAEHFRAIQREGLLLARSLLSACISKAEEHLSPKEETPKRK